METIFYRIMKILIVAILASFPEFTSAQNELIATTIQEPPYVKLKKEKPVTNEDFEGYIPDLLVKLARQPGCDCNFTLKLVEDGKYGVQEANLEWSGMIGEVISGKAALVAAPITYSDQRARVINFTDHLMTFDTVVLMKKTASMKRINSPVELAERSDITYGLVKDGFTDNFFNKSDKKFYKDLYRKMDKKQLPLTSRDGVRKVQKSDGKYGFMIESSTAEYWVNKKPCNLYTFRLGSALDCHKYAFAVKKDPRENLNTNNLWFRLERAIKKLKSDGELERLKAKWWPHECSAAAAFSITQLNVFLVIISSVVARRLI